MSSQDVQVSSPAPLRPRRGGAVRWGLIGVLLLALALIASLLIKVPYVIMKPGPAPNTLGELDGKKIISVSGTKTYPTSGALHFTTVSLYGGPGNQPSVLEYLFAKADSNAQVFPESDYFAPTDTKEKVEKQNKADMTGSQSAAEVVAGRKAGFTIPETVAIAAVDPKSDAAKKLKAGDIITEINGVTIADSSVLAAQMKKVKPGQDVSISVKRSGAQVRQSVKTQNYQGRAIMGLALDPRVEKMPFKVNMAVGDVGGPSAGLMFTLAIYDEITPGALTGGKDIAGTGEMSLTGDVGPIGGIREKVVGARNSGAEYFLAPRGDCGELKGHVPDGLRVFSVSTIDDALAAVKAIASNNTSGLATCG